MSSAPRPGPGRCRPPGAELTCTPCSASSAPKAGGTHSRSSPRPPRSSSPHPRRSSAAVHSSTPPPPALTSLYAASTAEWPRSAVCGLHRGAQRRRRGPARLSSAPALPPAAAARPHNAVRPPAPPPARRQLPQRPPPPCGTAASPAGRWAQHGRPARRCGECQAGSGGGAGLDTEGGRGGVVPSLHIPASVTRCLAWSPRGTSAAL